MGRFSWVSSPISKDSCSCILAPDIIVYVLVRLGRHDCDAHHRTMANTSKSPYTHWRRRARSFPTRMALSPPLLFCVCLASSSITSRLHGRRSGAGPSIFDGLELHTGGSLGVVLGQFGGWVDSGPRGASTLECRLFTDLWGQGHNQTLILSGPTYPKVIVTLQMQARGKSKAGQQSSTPISSNAWSNQVVSSPPCPFCTVIKPCEGFRAIAAFPIGTNGEKTPPRPAVGSSHTAS